MPPQPVCTLVCDAGLRLRPPRHRSRPRTGSPAPGSGGSRKTAATVWESRLAGILCRLEAKYGDQLAALDCFTVAIHNHHETGNTTTIRVPLADLAAFLDRLGRYEPAATIAAFSVQSPHRSGVPKINTAIAHLRDVLGDKTYESPARKGEAMTTAAMATYAYDQIDQARAALSAVSK